MYFKRIFPYLSAMGRNLHMQTMVEGRSVFITYEEKKIGRKFI